MIENKLEEQNSTINQSSEETKGGEETSLTLKTKGEKETALGKSFWWNFLVTKFPSSKNLPIF